MRDEAGQLQARCPRRNPRDQSRCVRSLPTRGDVETVLGFGDVQLVGLVLAQKAFHHLAQRGDKRGKRRREYPAFAHIGDDMRFRRMKADPHRTIATGNLEDGSTTRERRHGDDVFDLRMFETMARKRRYNRVALQSAIVGLGHILIGAAAAGSEMRAEARRRHDFRAATKNSRLPSPP